MKKIITFVLALVMCLPIAFAGVGCGKKSGKINYDANSGLYDDDGNLVMTWAEIVAEYPEAFVDGGKTITNVEYGESYFVDLEGVLVIDSSVTKLDHSAFEECQGLLFIDVPASVVRIGERAFANCFCDIFLRASSFDYIGKQWVDGSDGKVFFNQTKEGYETEREEFYDEYSKKEMDRKAEGKDLFFDYMDEVIRNDSHCLIYFYSKQAPQTSGHFWHFGLDGKTPTAWPDEH